MIPFARSCLRLAFLNPPAEKVHIPYEGTSMPGYLFLPDQSGGPWATIIFNNGNDGPISGMWYVPAVVGWTRRCPSDPCRMNPNTVLFRSPDTVEGSGEEARAEIGRIRLRRSALSRHRPRLSPEAPRARPPWETSIWVTAGSFWLSWVFCWP